MSFIWPKALLALLAVPLLVYGYVLLMRRRATLQSSLGTMGLPQSRSGKPLGRKRHVPPVLFLIGITLLLFGLARPQTTLDLPHRRGTVVLAFDVSNSMKAKDLAPTRMKAAKRAARAFVADQPSTIKIGVVAFANAGFVVQRPTTSKPDVLAAINRLSVKGGTSLAQGILTSISAVAGKPIALNRDALANGAPQPDVHFLGSAAVVLLSDGENTARLDPLALAPVAAQAGVRIFTIGIGTANGGTVQVDGFTLATNLDEPLLKQIAAKSNGAYFRAQDAASLTRIYSSIDLQLTVSGKKTEVTAVVAGAGLFLFIIGAALAMRWYGRML
jgi:Ca-activated chloride channel family protein